MSRKTYRCTNFIIKLWTCHCFFSYGARNFLIKSTLRVRSLKIYIGKSQCHFLSWTCSLSVTNSVTGNSWCHPVKTVTHKKVLLELEFSPRPWGCTFHTKLIMRDAKNNLSHRLPFEHENNLPHLTWLYWLIPVALLVKDDESLPWPKTQEKEKISVTFDN